MDYRTFMRKGEKITLCEENSKNKRTFSIISKDGAGSSSVSYIASCGRKTGRLKEFYPKTDNIGAAFSIVRQKDNQLFCSEQTKDASQTYYAMMDEYIESYHILEEAKKEAEKGNNAFSTFIPGFEIFRGCDQNGDAGASAYIWTIDNTGDFETFDKYLDNVRKHPARNPAKALYVILKTLYNLTECVKTLHTAGLIHSDIKPENFGFSIRDGRYLTEQVQLFDINSIYSVYTNFPAFTGTVGFCAPEVFKGKITNQSDLYSIGAVLFNAIASDDDASDGLYSDEYYTHIDEIVATSKLLNASPITASVRFQTKIAAILKKCLAKELKNRIDNCDELKKDLQGACAFLIPAQYNDALDLGNELKIIDKELEQYDRADTTFAFQSLLFNHPLYENADDTIRILIAGFGVYGQQFLDICLQAGQIKDKNLEITVVTQDKEAYKKEYLDKRPALTEFFEIDKKGDTSDTNYGKITFITPQEVFEDEKTSAKFANGFSKGTKKSDLQYNKALAEELLLTKCDSNYVFIALGEEQLNLSVAKSCAEVISAFKMKCAVACVCNNDKKHKGILTVNATAKASENKNYEEIERMAFNAHLSWSSPLKLNINLKKVRRKFLDKYDHDSSVACVLAIKNTLYSCGIILDDLSDQSIAKAASEYNVFIKKYKDVFAQLVYVEHKRWVVEKITGGWMCRSNLSDCLYGDITDKKKKLHPCIVKSKVDFNLEKYYKNTATGKWYKSKWNEECEDDKLLDDLDMVSVKLHRVFFEAAKAVKSSYSLNGEEADRINWIISEHKDCVIAFNEWMLCLKRIWDMDETQVKLYDGYRDIFTQTLSVLSKAERDEVIRYVKIIDSKVNPIIRAYGMRDYKSSDKDLINAVSFILTNRENRKLFIPLMTGDNTDRFNNVASATLINPDIITYGVYLRAHDNIKEFVEITSHILSYMDKKEIKSKLKFALVYNEGDKKIRQSMGELTQKLRNMDTRIRQAFEIPVSSEADIAGALSLQISADAYENNSAYLSALLVGAGFFANKPTYSFDSSNKKFTLSNGCEWLGYIKSGQFITIPDMLSFKNSTGVMEALPEYSEYKDLWKLYKGNSYAWKDMCKILEKYADTNDLISSFNIQTDFSNAKTLEFVIPNELRDSYNYIISYLRDDAQAIAENSAVEYKSIESCKVRIVAGQNNIDAARKLFANPYMLMNQRDISVRTKPKKAEILLNNLVVSELRTDDYPEYSDKKKKIGELLVSLQDKGYIYNLKNSDNRVFSFVYSTRQVKQLMISAGRILEIYVYHKLQESGFDDVVSGYEINWGDTDVKSEFDVLVTSGFKCAMIECKAQDKISQDYYYKLSCLAKQFGINAIPVLIADTHEKEDRDNSNNEMQRERGKMMGVVTVYDREDISNIDVTLRRILNGKY